MRVWLLAGLIGVMLLGCTTRPSRILGAPTVPPDEQYEEGGSFADRFLIWRCYEGQRVAMIQRCAPHSCGEWRVHRGPCGTPTAAEVAARGDATAPDGGESRERHEIPEGSRWR